MSVKVMSAVFDRYPNGGGEMVLALALADHASDDGTRVFPSVAALATKTRQSERTVQYQLRRMEEAGWLILVGAGNGGRSMHREYRISLDWICGADLADLQKGAEVAPFPDALKGANGGTKGCNPRYKRVQPVAPANNHQLTINEPSGGSACAHAAPTGGVEGVGQVGQVVAIARSKAVRKVALPVDLLPGDAVLAFAGSHGLSMAEELAAFCDHHAAHGTTMADWQAGLRGWLRNSVKFRGRDERAVVRRGASGGAQHRYAGAAAAIYGGVME